MNLANRLGFCGHVHRLRMLLTSCFNDMGQCMVVCEQEGAEVWSNGQKIGLTPCKIDLPLGKTVDITLKKFAFADTHRQIRTQNVASFIYVDMPRIPLRIIRGGLTRVLDEKISANSSH